MKKEKLTSIMIAVMLILSTLTILHTPIVKSGSFEDTSGSKLFFGTLEPQVVTGGYDGKEVVFQFSITSNTTEGVGINETRVDLPSGWENVQGELSLGNATWQVEANTISYVIFNCMAGNELTNGTVLIFNITAKVKVGVGTWNITCWTNETTPTAGSALINVIVTPYFDAAISPSVVKSGQTKDFNIVITNNASSSAIYKVNITYPSNGWTFNNVEGPLYWVLDEHDTINHYVVYRATGGAQIDLGESVTFIFTMTTGTQDGTWSVTCTNTGEQNANMTLTVDIDDTPPDVTISSPLDPRVNGAVWINGTAVDPNLKEWIIKINGTQVASGTTSEFKYQWDTTGYTDATYVINVTATDIVGNEGYDTVTVEVDNTAPQLIEIVLGAFEDDTWVGNYTPTGDVFWIPGSTTGIKINATFSDAGSLSGNVYFNVTSYTFDNNRWIPADNPYNISAVNSIPVKINITDDQGNRYVHTWIVSKDFNIPTTPTYTEYEVICGGIIIKGITSTDAESGIDYYNIYINGTAESITPAKLASVTWRSSGNLSSFSGVLVINLTAYAGSTVNITITSVDKADMESNATTIIETIPDGVWYPIELYEGWNLISLPLVPNSTSTSDILSLILKQGAAGVEVSYGFDNQAKEWAMNPTTMTDGNGYWVKMKDYDVLIVQGTPHEEYWGLEPVYYLLYEGWNLAGYTERTYMDASDYVQSLQTGTYFGYLFVWDAQNQKWEMIDTSSGSLTPGQGFWILLYEDQTLVPPVP